MSGRKKTRITAAHGDAAGLIATCASERRRDPEYIRMQALLLFVRRRGLHREFERFEEQLLEKIKELAENAPSSAERWMEGDILKKKKRE